MEFFQGHLGMQILRHEEVKDRMLNLTGLISDAISKRIAPCKLSSQRAVQLSAMDHTLGCGARA